MFKCHTCQSSQWGSQPRSQVLDMKLSLPVPQPFCLSLGTYDKDFVIQKAAGWLKQKNSSFFLVYFVSCI